MKYRFVKTQLKDCPDVTGWYLKLERNDLALFMEMHLLVTQQAALRYKKDPHLPQGVKKGEIDPIYNPIVFGIRWAETIQKHVDKYGVVLINRVGGWMPLTEQINILGELNLEKMEFPLDRVDIDTYVTISRWPNGKHYYLQSNKNHIFAKVNSLKEAMDQAKRVALEEHIMVKDSTLTELTPEQ